MLSCSQHIHFQAITDIPTIVAGDTEEKSVQKSVKGLKNTEDFVNANVVQLSKSNVVLCTRKKSVDGIHTATTNLSVSYFLLLLFDMSMEIFI